MKLFLFLLLSLLIICPSAIFAAQDIIEDGLIFHGNHPPGSERDLRIRAQIEKVENYLSGGKHSDAARLVQELLPEVIRTSSAGKNDGGRYSIYIYRALTHWDRMLKLMDDAKNGRLDKFRKFTGKVVFVEMGNGKNSTGHIEVRSDQEVRKFFVESDFFLRNGGEISEGKNATVYYVMTKFPEDSSQGVMFESSNGERSTLKTDSIKVKDPLPAPYMKEEGISLKYCRPNSSLKAPNIHNGIDIEVPATKPVYSICKGSIVHDNTNRTDYKTEFEKYWNSFLILKHDCDGQSLYAYYGHVRRSSIEDPTNIEAGEEIATIRHDTSGKSGDHLHLGISTGKDWVRHRWGYNYTCKDAETAGYEDPLTYLQFSDLGSSANRNDNLISMLYIRRDNITNNLRGEIYPVAHYSNGRYNDASIDIGEETAVKKEDKSLLSEIKDFFIFGESGKIGKFRIDEISLSPFMCSKMLTGKGKIGESGSLTTILDHISNKRSSHSRGFENKKEFDYMLTWTVAASRVYRVPSMPDVPDGDIGRYRADLMNMASRLLAEYSSDDVRTKEPILEDFAFFDLDHDGKLEVSAKIKKEIRNKIRVVAGKEEREEYSNDAVYLNLWLTYRGGDPQVVLSLIAEEREGSWGSGYDLVGTLDVNGDGTDEVIMRSSGWEVVDFEIYEYHNDKLGKVFHGAGFGC